MNIQTHNLFQGRQLNAPIEKVLNLYAANGPILDSESPLQRTEDMILLGTRPPLNTGLGDGLQSLKTTSTDTHSPQHASLAGFRHEVNQRNLETLGNAVTVTGIIAASGGFGHLGWAIKSAGVTFASLARVG